MVHLLFRMSSAAVTVPDHPGIGYRMSGNKLNYRMKDNKINSRMEKNKLDYRMKES